jgi:ABC-2 type transport system ATP-binding protein
MTAAIETTGLSRSFGDLRAVDRLDLAVEAGTFFGFLGPNGAGKSTTLKLLTGLLEPTSGGARVLGFDVGRDAVEVKKRIGVVPEQLGLFERLTASEQLLFAGRMHRLARPLIEQRSVELLRWMDLEASRDQLVVDLSHGMRKKLCLAAALLHQPRLLFLDEPFEGIDAVASRTIKALLQRLVATGVTVFLTSHILDIVEKLCTHVAIIDRGRLKVQGTVDQLTRGVTVGAGEAGRRQTLEEAFLALVGGSRPEPEGLSWLG